MTVYSRLEITNGTNNTIKLVNPTGSKGFHLKDWGPSIAAMKGGGVWRDSAISDGRQLVMRNWGNVAEALTLDISGYSQIGIITETQALRALIEQARDYWEPRSTAGPVWLVAQAACEDNPRYAYLYDAQTPNDNNPYGVAFNEAEPFFQDFSLGIERGHWMDTAPGATAPCVELSTPLQGFTFGSDMILNGGFETAGGGGADVFASWTETAGTGAIARITGAGNFYLGAASCQLTAGATANTNVLQNYVSVPGQLYSLVLFYRCVTSNVSPPRYQIIDNTGATDIVSITSLPTVFNTTEWRRFQVMFSAPGGCISVGIKLWCTTTDTRVTQIDNVAVTSMSVAGYGHAATCLPEVFSANKSSLAQLSHIFRYDASIATFSANLVGTAVPFDLFPNPIQAGDILYFGVSDAVYYSGPFSNLIFDLNQAAVGTISAALEYSTAAGFSAIPAQYVDTTAVGGLLMPVIPPIDMFSNTGVCFLNYEVGTNHAKFTVNGVYGWWIRVVVNAVAFGAPRPQQANQAIYTANQSAMHIDAAQIPGELPALVKMTVHSGFPVTSSQKRYLLATRKSSRGANFNPYLNLSPFMIPANMGVFPSGDMAYTTYGRSPSGNIIAFSAPLASGLGSFTVLLSNPLCNDYLGTFRLFIRGMLASGGATVVTLMSVRAGTTVTLNTTGTFSDIGQVHMLDLGVVTMPWADLGSREMNEIEFQFKVSTAAGPGILYLYDLLFVPVDEMTAEITTGSYVPTIQRYLEIDSTYPKSQIIAMTIENSTGYMLSSSNPLSPGRITLRKNTDQEFYMFLLDDPPVYASVPEVHSLIYPQLWRTARYFSMRGDQ